MKVQVIVVAGGMGQRLKSKVPKALVALKGHPLVWYCLRVFEAHKNIDSVVVVAPKRYEGKFAPLARKFKKVRAVVPGGARRSDSVRCGLKAITPETGIVLVHDAARPLVDKSIIDRLLAALKKNQAAIAAMPVKATIKKVNPVNFEVHETLARDLLWEAQTPQGFHKDVLVKAHARPLKQEATDDAMLVERLGIKVKTVMGSYHNIKITTPEDLAVMKVLL